MSEEHRQILEMLKAGRISVDEAERLLSALGRASPGGGSEAGPVRTESAEGKRAPKFVRVVVDEGETQVNVRVPVSLIRAGMKLQAVIPEEARRKIEKELAGKGIDLDFGKMKAGDVEELVRALDELTVDVDEGGKKTVRVFCE